MKPLIKWWNKLANAHLMRAIRYERIVLSAVAPSGLLPFLYLRITLNNGSETDIIIKRIYASLYYGAVRITSFDISNPFEKNISAGNRHYFTAVRNIIVKKGNFSEIEHYIYPDFNFWSSPLTDLSSPIFVLDGAFEIVGYRTKAIIKISEGSLKIDNINQAVNQYREVILNRLKILQENIK